MAEQRLLLDSAEAVALAAEIFPGLRPIWANGSLPDDLRGAEHVLLLGTDAEWVEAVSELLRGAGSAIVRGGVGDFLLIDRGDPATWLRSKIAAAPVVDHEKALDAGGPGENTAAKTTASGSPDEPVKSSAPVEEKMGADSPDAPDLTPRRVAGQPEAPPAAESGPVAGDPPDWHTEIPHEAAEVATKPHRPRKRPRLAAVDGNLALKPAESPEPLPQAMSEDYLAEHFVSKHGEDLKFVRKWFQWYEWDGDGWREDVIGKVNTLAIKATRESLEWPQAQALTPKERRMVNKRSTAGAVRELACDHVKIAARMEQWDADTMLLGCPGGVLDLKSGKMLEAERGQYITKRCAVAPENGKPELWLQFLETVCNGDTSLIAYLQRFAGYALTGETSEHSLAFCHGTGANGKTVFLHTLSELLGDYAVSAGIETFTETKNERHSTEIARLRGARLVVTEETDAGGRWAEGKIKRLTGGGKISAHFMRQDDFEFIPQFKLLIASNHKPMLRSTDEAIRRRFHMIPFAVTIPVEDRDHGLMDKLRLEWPQILGWMLDGCVAWQDCGLGLPEAIQTATDDYLNSEDILGQWISECCERGGRYESALLYRNYSEWAEKQGERAWSRRAWANALVDRGFTPSKSNGIRTMVGIKLLPSAVTAPQQYSR